MAITDETRELARRAAADLRCKGESALANAVESLLQATEPEAVPVLDYVTTSRAGDLLGVSGQTIKNWIRAGKLRGYRLGGRLVVPREVIETYVRRAGSSLELEDLSDDEAAAVVAEGRR